MKLSSNVMKWAGTEALILVIWFAVAMTVDIRGLASLWLLLAMNVVPAFAALEWLVTRGEPLS